jgi:hypothetical protein
VLPHQWVVENRPRIRSLAQRRPSSHRVGKKSSVSSFDCSFKKVGVASFIH